jgi:hypothetical protein
LIHPTGMLEFSNTLVERQRTLKLFWIISGVGAGDDPPLRLAVVYAG